jgi:MATE family multidrug resistance protein
MSSPHLNPQNSPRSTRSIASQILNAIPGSRGSGPTRTYTHLNSPSSQSRPLGYQNPLEIPSLQLNPGKSVGSDGGKKNNDSNQSIDRLSGQHSPFVRSARKGPVSPNKLIDSAQTGNNGSINGIESLLPNSPSSDSQFSNFNLQNSNQTNHDQQNDYHNHPNNTSYNLASNHNHMVLCDNLSSHSKTSRTSRQRHHPYQNYNTAVGSYQNQTGSYNQHGIYVPQSFDKNSHNYPPSHRSGGDNISHRSSNSRRSHNISIRDPTLSQAFLAAPSVNRSVRFSNRLTIATSITKDSIHKDKNIVIYPKEPNRHQLQHGDIATAGDSSDDSYKASQLDKMAKLDSFTHSFHSDKINQLAYQQEAAMLDTGRYISPVMPPHGYLLPHKDHEGDVSSVDVNDDDETPQTNSDIPYSGLGHLKYPPSEHLRYEYVRNDAYHHESIPFFYMKRIDRFNVVYEQEKLLKQLNIEKTLEKQAIAAKTPQHTCNTSHTLISHEENPSPRSNSNQTKYDGDDSVSVTLPSCAGCIYEQQHYNNDMDRGYVLYNDDDLARPSSFCDFYSRSELLSLLHLSVPLILSFCASYGVGLINLAFQGHLDEQSLAAAAMALFYQNLSGIAILYGLNSGIDTFGSQYYGSGFYKMVGLIGLRGGIIGTLAMILVAFFWWFSAAPLILFGIEEGISQLAQDYCRICVFALPGILYLDVLRRVLEVQQICIPSMAVNLIGLVLVAPLNWFFMDVMGYGFLGPAYSYVIINTAMFLALLTYFIASGIHKLCLPKKIFSMHLFQNWGQYLSIAIPSVGVIAGEWAAFEVQMLVCAKLGNTTALASQSLITSINAFIFNVPHAIGIAASCRVGAFLGGRKPACATLTYKTALRISWVTQFSVASLMWIFKSQIIALFTSVEAVQQAAGEVLPLLSLFCIMDGFQGMLQGVLRGFSAQGFSFLCNIFWFWVVALPLSTYLTLYTGSHDYDGIEARGMGLIGIWTSLLVASSGVMLCYLVYLSGSSWTKRTNYIYDILMQEEDQLDKLAEEMSMSGDMELEDDRPGEYDVDDDVDDDDVDDDGADIEARNNAAKNAHLFDREFQQYNLNKLRPPQADCNLYSDSDEISSFTRCETQSAGGGGGGGRRKQRMTTIPKSFTTNAGSSSYKDKNNFIPNHATHINNHNHNNNHNPNHHNLNSSILVNNGSNSSINNTSHDLSSNLLNTPQQHYGGLE